MRGSAIVVQLYQKFHETGTQGADSKAAVKLNKRWQGLGWLLTRLRVESPSRDPNNNTLLEKLGVVQQGEKKAVTQGKASCVGTQINAPKWNSMAFTT